MLLPDGGRGYLGKIFSESWMRTHGFTSAGEGPTLADVLAARDESTPELVHIAPDASVRTAIDTLRRYDVSQLVVLSSPPPIVLGEVVGTVSERGLLEAVLGGRVAADDPVSSALEPRLPLLGLREPVQQAREILRGSDALLVTEGGNPLTVLTRSDLLTFLSA